MNRRYPGGGRGRFPLCIKDLKLTHMQYIRWVILFLIANLFFNGIFNAKITRPGPREALILNFCLVQIQHLLYNSPERLRLFKDLELCEHASAVDDGRNCSGPLSWKSHIIIFWPSFFLKETQFCFFLNSQLIFFQLRSQCCAFIGLSPITGCPCHWLPLTHSFLFIRLDWCDLGVWRC